MYVVPLPSERCTTVMLVLGNVAPEFSAAMAGSFHFLMWPRKMLASVVESRFSELTPEMLNAIETTPRVTGIWVSVSGPPADVMSAAAIGTSVAPKSTVFLMNCWMPAPEPTAW